MNILLVLAVIVAAIVNGPTPIAHSVQPVTNSDSACKIGSRAKLEVPPSSEGLQGEALVVGCQHFESVGWVEIVGYDTGTQACVAVNYPRQMEYEGLNCLAFSEGRRTSWCSQAKVCPYPVGWAQDSSGVFTRLNGFAGKAITAVRLSYKKGGRTFYKKAFLSRITASLANQLRLPIDVVVITSAFQGCPPQHKMWVEAKAGRKVLSPAHAPNFFPKTCAEQVSSRRNPAVPKGAPARENAVGIGIASGDAPPSKARSR
jgi:hypothetical protein